VQLFSHVLLPNIIPMIPFVNFFFGCFKKIAALQMLLKLSWWTPSLQCKE
jgi:hypothetical protein